MNPTQVMLCYRQVNSCCQKADPENWKHLGTEEEKKIRFPSAASETGRAQTNKLAGVVNTLYGVTKEYIKQIIWKVESKR